MTLNSKYIDGAKKMAGNVNGKSGTKAPALKGGGLAGYLVCKCCNVSMSDESTYLGHIQGKPHQKKSGGEGFCGLLPNAQAPSQARFGIRKFD
jgi:hypothetical protein